MTREAILFLIGIAFAVGEAWLLYSAHSVARTEVASYFYSIVGITLPLGALFIMAHVGRSQSMSPASKRIRIILFLILSVIFLAGGVNLFALYQKYKEACVRSGGTIQISAGTRQGVPGNCLHGTKETDVLEWVYTGNI